MAREHASIRLDIWTDQNWRSLTRDEQWLYILLLSHPSLSYAGVADWRPGRLSPLSAGTSKAEIEKLGAQLQSKRFILINEESEEVLIRSFLKHDGLLKQPKLTVSMVNAFGEVASSEIREVLVYELRKICERHPDWKGVQHDRVRNMIAQPARSIDEFTQGFTPDVTPSFTPGFTPNAGQALGLRTSTSTSTPSKEGGVGETSRRKPEVPLPSDFTPTPSHESKAKELGVNLQWELEKFENHHRARDSRFRDWNQALHGWIKRSAEYSNGRPGSPPRPQSSFDPWASDWTEDDFRKDS